MTTTARTRAWRTLAMVGVIATASIALAPATTAGAEAARYPVKAKYTAAGPYQTLTGTVVDSTGAVIYDLYYPSNYAALGFKSPIVTWGNGTNAVPSMYTTLLRHFASYGFTVIASTLENTGSGREIDAAAHYLIAQDRTAGSVFRGRLAIDKVAAVGHSQGAGGATRAAVNDPAVIKTVITFSLPNFEWIGANPDCPTAADCTYDPAQLTRPIFLISTHGRFDSIIASPATEQAFYASVKPHAALGIIERSHGVAADHSTIQDTANGGAPTGFLGYATAWLEYQLRGNAKAGAAFRGPHAELVANGDWPESAARG
jgi:hypothetical protein